MKKFNDDVVTAAASGIMSWMMNQIMDDSETVFDQDAVYQLSMAVSQAAVQSSSEIEFISSGVVKAYAAEALEAAILICAKAEEIKPKEWLKKHLGGLLEEVEEGESDER